MKNIKYIPGDLVTLDVVPEEASRIILASSPASSWGHNENSYTLERPDGNTFVSKEQYLRGISLTPQILEANGWVKSPFGTGGFIERYTQNGSILFIYHTEDDEWICRAGDYKINIEFVHQLQHLLFGLGLNSELKV